MPTTKPAAYSYIRMSTPDQIRGDSLRRQMARTAQYAAERGLEIVDRFNDIGKSGFRGKHVEFGALGEFKGLVDRGEIERGSFLIVESMDRLSRQKVMPAFVLMSEIITKGITIVTLDDRQEYSEENLDKNHLMLIIALGAMSRAHEESRRKSEMLSHAWGEKRRKAREEEHRTTRRVPAWLKLDRSKNEIAKIESRVAIVGEIFRMVRDGWGAYSVARHLNQRGEKPWGNKKNAVWRESYIKKIIRSRTVLGEYQPCRVTYENKRQRREPDGEPIVGYYPAAISLSLYQEANLAMSRRAKQGKGRKGPGYSNLFTGLLRCSCSAGYRYLDKGKGSRGGQYLQCTVAFAKGHCNQPKYPYQVVEEAILQAIGALDIQLVLGGEARNLRINEKRTELALVRADYEHAKTQISNLAEAIALRSTSKTPAALTQKLAEIEQQQSSTKARMETLAQEIQEELDVDPEKRRVEISALIEKIRQPDGMPTNEDIRRALAAELGRMVRVIEIAPSGHIAWEFMDDYPDWQERFGVRTTNELERMIRQQGFILRFLYRNGERSEVIPLDRKEIKISGSMRLDDMRLINRLDQ